MALPAISAVSKGVLGLEGFDFSLKTLINMIESSMVAKTAKAPLAKMQDIVGSYSRSGEVLTGKEAAALSVMTSVGQAIGGENMSDFLTTFDSEAEKQNEMGLTWYQEARENLASHVLMEAKVPEPTFSRRKNPTK